MNEQGPATGDEKMNRKDTKSPKDDQATNCTKHGYEATVKARALAQAGGNPNLNGHILEVMGADKTNLNPVNWVKGVQEAVAETKTGRLA